MGLKAAFIPQSLRMTEEQMHGKGKVSGLPVGHTQLPGTPRADRGPVALASCSRSYRGEATNGRSPWTFGSGPLRATGPLIAQVLRGNPLILWQQKSRAETSLCICDTWVKHQKPMFPAIKPLTRTGDTSSGDDHWHFSCRQMKHIGQTPEPQGQMASQVKYVLTL